MKSFYALLIVTLGMIPSQIQAQAPCNAFIYTASETDMYYGEPDTLCVGSCQKYWVRNLQCPEYANIGFHWVFYRPVKNDTLVGDTVYYCFNDTGSFRMDIYASNFNPDSAYNLNINNVILPCPPIADFIADKQMVCINKGVTFADKSKGGANSWQWVFEGGTPGTYTGKQPPPVYYADTGLFNVQLTVTSPYGVSNEYKTSYIHILPGPTPVTVQQYFQLKEGDEVTINACAIGSSYEWVPPTGITENADSLIIIQPDESENYLCIVTTTNGCNTECYYTVIVQRGLLVPTAFSPNNDGVNDVFRILNTNIKLLNLAIYNRWGEQVFYSTGILDGWDGIYKGIPQPMGTFVWACDYEIIKTGKRKSAKGNVTLLR